MSLFVVKSLPELLPIAKQIASLCASEKVIVFDGEMGAGKTTLIGAICAELNVTTPISSPTYGIVNTYFSEQFGEMYHFDFYRLENEEEAVRSGLDELIDSGNVCFLEWAERISKLLPKSYVRVSITLNNDQSRSIEITKVDL